jgi:hypothetical protein
MVPNTPAEAGSGSSGGPVDATATFATFLSVRSAGKIDEILSWEQAKEHERDERFVELGEYLCEVRAGQYWRLG